MFEILGIPSVFKIASLLETPLEYFREELKKRNMFLNPRKTCKIFS